MAIEFECPSCSATIRVPDAYAGRQGRCPDCNERLLVPIIAGQSDLAAAAAPVPPTPRGTPADSGASPLPLVDRKPITASKARRKSRRPSRALVVGIPVLGFLLLLGIIAYTVTESLPDLNGKLSATVLAEKSIPRTVIPWSETGLGQEDRETLTAAMIESPERLASDLMSCQLIGSEDGLEILLTAPTGCKWCVVETANGGQKPLQLWRKRERDRWNAERRKLFLQALKDYCAQKLRQTRGEKVVIDGIAVRDNVALASQLDALGFAVEGRIGNRIIKAASESEAGMIYFCVPEKTVSFMIQGRSLPNGQKMFPGEYLVSLATGAAAAGKPDSAVESTTPTPAGNMSDSGAAENTTETEGMQKSDQTEPGGTTADPPASGQMTGEQMTPPDGSMMNSETSSSALPMQSGFAAEQESAGGMQTGAAKKKRDMPEN